MQLYRLFCEYDVDQEYVVFTTEDKAYQHAQDSLQAQFDDEFTWESMIKEALVSVEELKIDP